uniref:Uncharacterized protein n=1 Tax=Anguilla anguilla TaxID=7936 RepID=A0A0E9XXG4_ANGAN
MPPLWGLNTFFIYSFCLISYFRLFLESYRCFNII